MAVKILFLLPVLISKVSCGQNSLTFVIDNSPSMGYEIDAVKNAAKSIIDIVLQEKSSQIEDIVLVTFRNYYSEPEQNVILRKKTRNEHDLKKALDSVNIESAGCLEVALTGMKKGLQESRLGSYMFVFSDTSSKDHYKYAEVKTLCQEKQIQVIIILTDNTCGNENGDEYQVYYKIAKACNGHVFRIVETELNQVLEFVKDIIKGEEAVIETKTIPPSTKWTEIPFNVDEHTEKVKVSASGTAVELEIHTHSGHQLSGTHIMWTRNVKSTRLTNLQPGVYTAKVRGHSEVTIQIVGRTDFQFQHGFSTTVQTNLKATDTQPTTAVETRLMVFVQDKTHSVLIRKAELLDMTDQVLMTLPLTNVEGDTYKTDMFLSPEQMFKISIVAVSKTTGSIVKRIAKTPVTPIPSVAPAISTVDSILKVKEDSSIDVYCRIIGGKPRPQISWYLKKHGTNQFTALASTDEVYHVKKASTNDQYKCVAKNVRGQAEHVVTLDVQTRPKFQDTTKTITTKEGEPVTIDCKLLKGNPRPKVSWYFKARDTSAFTMMSHGGEVWHIPATHLSNFGTYKCSASNNEGSDEKITELVVKAKPIIDNTTPNQSVMENITTSLHCRVRGFPKPTVNWFYKGSRSAKYEMISRNSNSYVLKHVQLSDAGKYKCIAENEMGEAESTVEVTVNAPPRIVFVPPNSPNYSGVEGDVAIRLQCDAVGYPIPTITWMVDNRVIGMDESKELYVKKNNLLLLNPKKTHSSGANSHTYVCQAKNSFGEASQPYAVYISEYVDDNPDDTVYADKERPYNFTCPLPFTNPNSVRWYKNHVVIKTGPTLHVEDKGNYTCRVSDLTGAASYTVEVVFGSAPKKDQLSYKIKWKGEEKTLACYANESPTGKYDWWFNGKAIEGEHTDSLQPFGWGQYTCHITHPLGNLSLDFKVTTKNKECGILTSFLKAKNAPLILNSFLEWPTLPTTGQYLTMRNSGNLQLICQDESSTTNTFTKYPTFKSINATCDKEDLFLVNGISQKITDLKCQKSVTSSIVKTRKSCQGENTELMRVGFHIKGFTEVYQSCVDSIRNVPLYTKLNTILKKKASEASLGVKSSCEKQCCYEQIQLVNAADVSIGPAEKATFIDSLNSVNYCKPKNSSYTNWHDIEKISRERSDKEQFTVWSGAAKYSKIAGVWTPKYLWKVMKPKRNTEMVVIHENAETAGPKLCAGSCGEEVVWLEPAGDGTYCCSLDDFKKAFGVAIDFN